MDKRVDIAAASQALPAAPAEGEGGSMSFLGDAVAVLMATCRQLQSRVDQLTKRLNEVEARQELTDEQVAGKQDAVAPDGSPAVDDTRLEFDFHNHNRKEVYAAIIEARRAGLIKSNVSQLERFLAAHTNLGSRGSIHTQLYNYGI